MFSEKIQGDISVEYSEGLQHFKQISIETELQ